MQLLISNFTKKKQKSDPNIFINNSNNYYQHQSELEQHPSYFVNETHNVHLVKVTIINKLQIIKNIN